MRRLLFVSYWVPPRMAIGTVRSSHLIKHLSKFGWEVTTVTACLGSDRTAFVETGFWDVKGSIKHAFGMNGGAENPNVAQYGSKRPLHKRAISLVSGLVTYPDEQVGWVPHAARTLRDMVTQNQWDAILSSAPPMSTNLAVALAHGRVPWVADMRDLWAEDDSTEHSALRSYMDDKLERLCLGQASAMTATSERSAQRFRQRHPGKLCVPISTGFDDEEWQVIPFGSEPECTLLYAGTLYRGKRDPSMLFTAVRRLLDEGSATPAELRVDFYTPRETWLLELIARFGLDDVVRVHGFVDRSIVLAAQRRADRLIVLSWDGPTAEGVVAGKLFEYFGARRPVLAIGGPPVFAVEDLLNETGTGVRCRTIDDTAIEIRNAITQHRNGAIRMIEPSAVAAYTGEACAQQFARVLNGVASSVT